MYVDGLQQSLLVMTPSSEPTAISLVTSVNYLITSSLYQMKYTELTMNT